MVCCIARRIVRGPVPPFDHLIRSSRAAATRRDLPLIGTPDFAGAGALISYMFDPVDLHAQAASYIDRILRGANPADLPVQQPTKYSLIINLKTAKALGLAVPPALFDPCRRGHRMIHPTRPRKWSKRAGGTARP